MVVVGHLDGLDALVAELPDVAAHGDAAEALGVGLLLDHEARDALVGAGRQRDEAGALAVRHPRLRARDAVLVAVSHGAAGDRARVAPGVGLGQRERAPDLAGGEPRKPPLSLLAGAVRL